MHQLANQTVSYLFCNAVALPSIPLLHLTVRFPTQKDLVLSLKRTSFDPSPLSLSLPHGPLHSPPRHQSRRRRRRRRVRRHLRLPPRPLRLRQRPRRRWARPGVLPEQDWRPLRRRPPEGSPGVGLDWRQPRQSARHSRRRRWGHRMRRRARRHDERPTRGTRRERGLLVWDLFTIN